MPYWYLASPYALYRDGKQVAYEAALSYTANLLVNEIAVYSPIVHNHPLSLLDSLKTRDGDFDFWVEQVDRPMMEGAGGLIVLELDGWHLSKGVLYEINLFLQHRKPVVMADPDKIPNLPQLDRPLDIVLVEELKWQDETFPSSTSYSRSKHLLKEAVELVKNPEDPEEMADILLLLSHLAMGCGGPNVSLARAVLEKQAKNKERAWGEPDADGVVEHIRED